MWVPILAPPSFINNEIIYVLGHVSLSNFATQISVPQKSSQLMHDPLLSGWQGNHFHEVYFYS
jgi:hypothetical protein